VAGWELRLFGLIVVTLVAFGIVAVYGASSIWAIQNDYPGSRFAVRQIQGALAGLVLLLVATRVDYHVWQRDAWLILGAVALVLIVPLLPFTESISPERNGARRWVGVGQMVLQPSEFAKFAIVAWTAMLAAKKGTVVRSFKRGVLPFIVILVPACLLILLEPDLSTASLTILLAAIVLFTAGARIGHFLVVALVALPFAWQWVASAQYRLQRMMSFLSPGEDLADASWQISQSLIGFGSGRLFGLGFGQGLQKLGYLPYAYSDFIFSTVGEEWGFVGVTLIVLLYAVFIAIGLRIARTARDSFGMLLAAGLTALIGLTALLHMAVTLSLVPATGLPLPFVSYGRSNLLVSLFTVGVLINIGSQGARQRARS
jgi:cell division protein FtsW